MFALGLSMLFDRMAAFRQKTSIPPRRLAACGKIPRANSDFGIRPSRPVPQKPHQAACLQEQISPKSLGLARPVIEASKGGIVIGGSVGVVVDYYSKRVAMYVSSAISSASDHWLSSVNATLDVQHRVRRTGRAIDPYRNTMQTPDA